MYAIIKTGGKQYKVQEGDILQVEKLSYLPGDEFSFSEVLLVSTDEEGLIVGKPFVETAKVGATMLENGKGDKVIIFKYKPKKDYRKKQGHRQPFTRVQINKITY